MGWRTKQRFASIPSALACAAAACLNPLEAIATEGTPWISNHTVSCKLHVVQEPQSASASITKLLLSLISWRNACGAGLVNVGLE